MEVDIYIAGDPKRRKQRAASLPDEIVNEILLLLSARSVLRFRAVTHTEATSDGSSQVQGGDAAMDPLFIVDRLRTDFLSLSTIRPLSGLMLFRDTRTSGRDFWVCNPSTGECKALPQPRPWGMILMSSAGLVLDDRTRECKVVHLFAKDMGLECEVYTLSETGGRWRPPTTDLNRHEVGKINAMIRALKTEDVVTKVPPVSAAGTGCLHWLIYPSFDGWSPDQNRGSILRFSAIDESFDFLDAPSVVGMGEIDTWRDDDDSPAVPFHLAELKGSLCMVHDLRRRHQNINSRGNENDGGRSCSSLDIWVLRRDRVEWSLDYHIAVGPLLARDVHSPRFITVLGCYSGGGKQEDVKKLLLVATSEHKVYGYAPDTGRVDMVFSAQDTSAVTRSKLVETLGSVSIVPRENMSRLRSATSTASWHASLRQAKWVPGPALGHPRCR
ncbi:hypothetical protein QOZ80_8BG0661040 [Eleusine coracana subsp. coracana]|nr:hypothetical protein QOZ80_8BG0661040 [Eleusine coracana subsp. coracana]